MKLYATVITYRSPNILLCLHLFSIVMWHPTTWSMALDSCTFGWSICEVYIELDFLEEVCVDNYLLFPICGHTVSTLVYSTSTMLIALALLFLGFDNPVLAAVSNAVTFKNPNEPLHGHLALTGNPTEMR